MFENKPASVSDPIGNHRLLIKLLEKVAAANVAEINTGGLIYTKNTGVCVPAASYDARYIDAAKQISSFKIT